MCTLSLFLSRAKTGPGKAEKDTVLYTTSSKKHYQIKDCRNIEQLEPFDHSELELLCGTQ